jgi:hypothetical protein
VKAVKVGSASLGVVGTHGIAANGLLLRTQLDGRVKAVDELGLDNLLVRLDSLL